MSWPFGGQRRSSNLERAGLLACMAKSLHNAAVGKEISRNDRCPCGSGKKYKNCCLGKAPPAVRRRRGFLSILLVVASLGGGIYAGIAKGVGLGIAIAGAGLTVAILISAMLSPPSSKGSDGAANINFGK